MTRATKLVRLAVAGIALCVGACLMAVDCRGLAGRDPANGPEGRAAWVAPPSADKVKNPVPPDARSLGAGRKTFADSCAVCHGTAGKGDGPAAGGLSPRPADLTSARVQQQSDGALFYKITEGRGPMPSFKTTLTEQQRWDVVNHIRTLAPKAPKSS